MVVLSLLCASCATPGPSRGSNGTTPKPAAGDAVTAIDWVDLAGSWPGPKMYRVELITFIGPPGTTSYRARYDTEVFSQGMTMVAHTLLGVPLYELSVQDSQMHIQRYVSQLEGVPIEKTLMDFVLSYWPIHRLQTAIQHTGYQVIEIQGGREFRDTNGQLIVEIRLPSTDGEARTTTEIIHHDVSLKLMIETLHLEFVPR